MSTIPTPDSGPGLPRDDVEPVFDTPWQAQAFSLIVQLHRAGRFAWRDWVQVFSEQIRTAPAQPGESANDAYYRQWVAAMERMVGGLGLAGKHDIDQRAAQWRQAYLNTPHGHPVALAHADCPPAHAHPHRPQRTPVATSPACRP
ncbi:nitrile hydratase accessory protein [Xanthomonas arboricola]|uniref:nitrile hydratase accessory protein n=1 Tax=Xanthomonas arboricola TaxID=56448 RepID=UPI000CEEE02A|nr:nitrile hydratase accessory protein [Xanthomonas arboricola]PPU39799.1 nitrile hydratase accessory protein [Xanthomonas arboricola pv. populi]